MEASQHEYSCFATLTYADDRLPAGNELVPRDLQLFVKRLRRASLYSRLRYFAVGEYGDKSWRPHYHAAIFGYPACQAGGFVRGECQCQPCSVVRATWGFGHVFLGELSISSAAYIGGYVVKKLTRKSEPALGGRHPEFARMSLRPGIGALAVKDVASAMMPYLSSLQAVPAGCRHASINASMPFGKYLRKRLGDELGIPHAQSSEVFAEELRLVRAFASATGRSVKETYQELAGDEPRYKERGSL